MRALLIVVQHVITTIPLKSWSDLRGNPLLMLVVIFNWETRATSKDNP